MKDIDKSIFICGIILAVILTEFIIFGGLGISVVLGVSTYLIGIFYLAKKLGKKQNHLAKGLLLTIILLTLCFGLFNDGMMKFFNIIFLIILVGVHALVYFREVEEEAFSINWCKYMIGECFSLPFENIEGPINFIKERIGHEHDAQIKVIIKIVVSIFLAMPILLLVVGLLIQADAAFEGTIQLIIDMISHIEIGWSISRFVVIVISFFMIFSYFKTLIIGKRRVLKEALAEEAVALDTPQKEEKSTEKGWDFTMVATFTSLLVGIYFIFCLSQFTYFISAFQGILPEDFSSAEYARRGFFEALPIVGLNVVVIMLLNIGTNLKNSIAKRRYVKSISCFMIGFSAFISASALAKMFMYMRRYGLTRKRMLVAWALIVMLIGLGMILLKLFKTKLNLVKHLATLFVVMYLGLNFASIDYVVASYNLKLYEKGIIENLDFCYGSNDTVIISLQRLVEAHPEISDEEAVDEMIKHFKVCHDNEEEVESQNWEQWNLADSLVDRALEKL